MDDDFLRHHRAYHERQQARLLLLYAMFGVAFIAIAAMLFIAFR